MTDALLSRRLLNHGEAAPARRGSVLLLMIVIMVVLTVAAYGFVRAMRTQTAGGDSAIRDLLARDQARSGMQHALSVIIGDYVNEPFTRMDGPAHAVFQSQTQPYNTNASIDLVAAQAGENVGYTDVPVEHPLFGPQLSSWWHGWLFLYNPYWNGDIAWDGRGQYFEPGFYNRPALTGFQPPVHAAPQTPVPQLPFGVDLAPGSQVPAVANGVFYTERWQRITGDPATARTQARYRIRYAVGVVDLEGELVMNPDPGVDPSQIVSPDPRTYANPGLARIVRAQHALPAMIQAWNTWCNDLMPGVRAEHVFLGRGYASNFNQSAGTNNAPSTFPMMYRRTDDPQRYKSWDWSTWQNGWPADPPHLSPTLFHTSDGVVSGLPQGGEVLKPSGTMYHVLTGPQYSSCNLDYSCGGNASEYPWGGDGFLNPFGSLTPFGRGITLQGTGRYAGAVDTPWCVNVMTAPAQVVMAMVGGLLPAGVVQCTWLPNPLYPSASAPSPMPTLTSYVMGTRDLMIAPLSAAFTRYPGPSSAVGTPDYHVPAVLPTDPGYLPPAQRYPGEMAFNGYNAAGVLVQDTLGTYLRTVAVAGQPSRSTPAFLISAGRDPSTGQWLWHGADPTGNYEDTVMQMPSSVYSDATQSPPLVQVVFDYTGYQHQIYGPGANSIWGRLGEAMSAAIAQLRGEWLQYPNGNDDPTTLFDGQPWTGPRAQSMADLDRLFLADLGIDSANPTAAPALKAWSGDRWTCQMHSFVPGWNPATLTSDPGFAAHAGAYAPVELTADMELIINDFRLAFLGSSPAYNTAFRALDLNGDGLVTCSGFPPNPAATPRQQQLHIDQFVPVATALSAPPPVMFAPTGTFFMGKSKFWEVVSRGEVWDNVLKRTISEATLDEAIVVDPADEAHELGGAPQRPFAQYSTHVLYSRWFFDKYRGLMGRDY